MNSPRANKPNRAEIADRDRRGYRFAAGVLRSARRSFAGHALWQSRNSTAWTVVYEADPRFQVSCLNRFIYVKGVKDLTEALHCADAVTEKFRRWAWLRRKTQARGTRDGTGALGRDARLSRSAKCKIRR